MRPSSAVLRWLVAGSIGITLAAAAAHADTSPGLLSRPALRTAPETKAGAPLHPGVPTLQALASDGSWTRLAIPLARIYTSMVYDPVRDRALLFSGQALSGWLDEVTVLPLTNPSQRSSINTFGTPPSGRIGHGAVYDPVRDRMIVIGGYDGHYLSDAWSLSLSGTPVWTQLAVQGTPPIGRAWLSAIYDPIGDRLIIFGGYAATGVRNDVWALSLGSNPTWTELTPSGSSPSARELQSAIYDPGARRMIIFGGNDENSAIGGLWALSLDGTPTWTELAAAGTDPGPHEAQSAIYDAVRDRMLMFGGYSSTYGNDVWSLSLGGDPTWTELAPSGTLPGRDAHVAIYDPVRDQMVVASGWDGVNYLGDAWVLSLGTSVEWSQLYADPPGPTQRSFLTAIHDPVRDRMLIYGGVNNSGALGDVWSLSLSNPTQWVPVVASGTPPPGRYLHSAIYDPVRDRMIVFGGRGSTSTFGDVWALTLSGSPSWVQLVPDGTAPTPRGGHSAVYDPLSDRMIVFGGAPGPVDEVWSLDLAGTPKWTPVTPAGPQPTERFLHGAVYDPGRAAMVIYGGQDSVGIIDSAWELGLSGDPVWTFLTPSGTSPDSRAYFPSVYDGLRDRMIVSWGLDKSTNYAFDLWTLSLSPSPSWSPLLPDGTAPHAREGHVAIYDQVRDRMVVFGGYYGQDLDDTWALQFPGIPTPALVSLVRAEVGADGAELEWYSAALGLVAGVERQAPGSDWVEIGSVSPDGTGFISFLDPNIQPGMRYGYRLAITGPGGATFVGETWITVPIHSAFALSPIPNPSNGEIVVSFSLPSAEPATLELDDILGRVVERRQLGGAPRYQQFRLGQARRFPPGVYVVRLGQAGHHLARKVAVVH